MTYYEYKTTSDHFSDFPEKQKNNYDSGFHSYHASTTTSPYYSTTVDSDGYDYETAAIDTRFDSGRGPPPPQGDILHAATTRGKAGGTHKSSEIVVGGNSAFVSGHSSHDLYNGGARVHGNLVRSSSAFVPTSSYHTHPPDNRHPKQELIAGGPMIKQLGGGTVQQQARHLNPSVATPGIMKNLPTRHSSADDVFERTKQQKQQQWRQRSVSPQFERRVTNKTTSVNKQLVTGSKAVGINHQKVGGSKTYKAVLKKSRFMCRMINMAEQINRESSFNHYPLWTGKILPYSLAVTGFYFTGQEDIVKCFECSIVLDDWKENDYILLRHFITSPNCSYLREQFFTEIIADLCPKLFSKYSIRSARYDSFKYWPIRCIITEGQMADAGFFYENVGVTAQCYACGIVKEDWKEGDNPIDIHLKLSPDCPHLMELRTSTVQFSQYAQYRVQCKTYDDRLKSFKHMPSNSAVDKVELAQAGFVLIKPPCTVKCLDCNLIIEDWVLGDDPLIKHSKYSPDCTFIKSGAGMDLQTAAVPKKKTVSIADNDLHDLEESLLYGSLISLPPSYKNQYSNSSSGSGTQSLPSRQVSDESVSNSPMTSSVGSATSTGFMRSKSTPASSITEDDSKYCVVCYENSKECAMDPCGHFCVCISCAEKLSECPICRRKKEKILKIYIP